MATYRLFGDLQGPKTATAAPSGGLLTGLMFQVSSGSWLDGYWVWVCPDGGSTAPQKFALWIPYEGATGPTGALVPGTTVTSAELVPGQWNFVPLPQAVGLSVNTLYQLETGWLDGTPVTLDAWGSGNRWPNGVTEGLLYAPPAGPNSMAQGSYDPGQHDPTKAMTLYNVNGGSLYWWIDVQVTTEAPPGSSYRLWPGMPAVPNAPKNQEPWDSTEQSCGTEFRLSDAYPAYTLNKIWFYSPVGFAGEDPPTPKAGLLPSSCAIFNIPDSGDPADATFVEGTVMGEAGPSPSSMPDWRKPDGTVASPGDGWVYQAYDGIKLPPGKYKTAIYSYAGGTTQAAQFYFFDEAWSYFGSPTGDSGAVVPHGIVFGPLSSPAEGDASPAYSNDPSNGTLVPGNSTYINNGDATNDPPTASGVFLYPAYVDVTDFGENRWIDVEVTPVSAPRPARGGTLLTSFP